MSAYEPVAVPLPKPEHAPPDLMAEDLDELERAAANEDGDEIIAAEVFLPSIGIAWPPAEHG